MTMLGRLAKKLFFRLPANFRYELFYQSGVSLDIRGYMLDGSQGAFLGSVRDRTIMRSYLTEKAWSPELMAPLALALAEGGAFVDVGANIGLVSLTMARLPNVHVWAFEPDEENHAYLLANIAMHRRRNVTVIQAAAWHEAATLKFARNNYNGGDHHIDVTGEVTVQAQRLDALSIPDWPLVVKIDTQGAEPAVLSGGIGLLRRAQLVMIEFWPWGMGRMGLKPSEAVESLRALGFGGCIIQNGRLGPQLSCDVLCETLTRFALLPSEYQSLDLMLRPD